MRKLPKKKNQSKHQEPRKNGIHDQEIQEIVTEFSTNQPKKIWKQCQCPKCGNVFDCPYNQFDAKTVECDCRLDYAALDGHNIDFLISLK